VDSELVSFYTKTDARLFCSDRRWVMRQPLDMHRESVGLQQTTLCCPSHEHINVEQPIHRASSSDDQPTGHNLDPPGYQKVGLR